MESIFDRFPDGKKLLSNDEANEVLRLFDDFKTWGAITVPFDESSPMNSYYLVPKKMITAPTYQNKELGVDYWELTGIIKNETTSYFCCEYYYSYDEFRRTKYRGTFKIKICKENKPILDWIVKKRFLILMNKSPKTTKAMDPKSLLHYFLKNPGFALPFSNITGLAFCEEYLDLIDPGKQG